ncbi:MAG: hypothetical protein ACK4ZD_13160 [Caldimonas sp.]|uniref:hypothetical protein n=1 Tax=Caldimonas sp. TaxID=2838790 RepID=UPI00391ADD2F
MSATTIKLPSASVHTAAPRGAAWAASIFASVLNGLRAVGRHIVEQRRLWAETRAIQEMLRLADTYSASQPGFAAELRAAAMRLQSSRDE